MGNFLRDRRKSGKINFMLYTEPVFIRLDTIAIKQISVHKDVIKQASSIYLCADTGWYQTVAKIICDQLAPHTHPKQEISLEVPLQALDTLIPDWLRDYVPFLTRLSFMEWPVEALPQIQTFDWKLYLSNLQSWNIDIWAEERYSEQMIHQYAITKAPHLSLYGFDDQDEKAQAMKILERYGYTAYDNFHMTISPEHRSVYLISCHEQNEKIISLGKA